MSPPYDPAIRGHKITPERHARVEDGQSLPFLVWRLPAPMQAISTATVGGGIGTRAWVINAQVRTGYDRADLDAHVGHLAALAGLPTAADEPGADPPGVGLLTAANVEAGFDADDGGVHARASVGVRLPTWAAAPATPLAATADRVVPGTINVVAVVPAPHTDAALVNLVTTATEAKAQAMVEAGLDGTGTATDAVCILVPSPRPGEVVEPFGGVRSRWGALLARSVHAAVAAGIVHSRSVIHAEQARAAGAPQSAADPVDGAR